MQISDIVSKLIAREISQGQWMARCPAHEDKSPSLSIKGLSDGTILIHCFAGCCPSDVLAEIGLELKDLFPKNGEYHRKSKKPIYNPRDLLELVRHELTVLLVWLAKIDHSKPLSNDDQETVERAKSSLVRALEIINA